MWSQAPVSLGNYIRQARAGTAGHQSGSKGMAEPGCEVRSSGQDGETREAPQDWREGAQMALATGDTCPDRVYVILTGSVIVLSDTRHLLEGRLRPSLG